MYNEQNETYEQLLEQHAAAKARMNKGITLSAVACGIATVASFFSIIPIASLLILLCAIPFYATGIPFLVTGIVRRVKANNRINQYKINESLPTVVGRETDYEPLS